MRYTLYAPDWFLIYLILEFAVDFDAHFVPLCNTQKSVDLCDYSPHTCCLSRLLASAVRSCQTWNVAVGHLLSNMMKWQWWCSNLNYNTWQAPVPRPVTKSQQGCYAKCDTWSLLPNLFNSWKLFFRSSGGASCAVAHHADRNDCSVGEERRRQDQWGRSYSRGLEPPVSPC